MSTSKTPIAFAIGTALAGSVMLSGSAFAMHDLGAGYMQSSTQDAAAKASEGQCGAPPKAGDKAKSEGKCGEGKCGAGKCGAAAKADAAAKTDHEGGCGMAMMDKNKDGKIDRAEFAAAHGGKDDKFAAHDLNGDGGITRAEMDQHHAQMRAKSKAEGQCGAAPKAGEKKSRTEGKCGEGKCGEGKCGGNK